VDKNDPGAVLIPFSGICENKIFDMDEAERAKYFEEHKVTRYRLPRVGPYNDYYLYPLNVCGLRCRVVAPANERVQASRCLPPP